MKKNITALLILILTVFINVQIFAEGELTLQNPGFEESTSGSFKGWITGSWVNEAGAAVFANDTTVSKSGTQSVSITNVVPNDSRLKQEVKVKPGTYYKLSCWIRTQNVGTSKGANISVQDVTDTSQDIKGTTDQWELVELYGKAGSNQKSFILTLGLGGYGSLNTGKAWFDDVKVEELKELPKGINAISLSASSANNSNAASTATAPDKSSSLVTILLLYLFAGVVVLTAYWAFFSQEKNTGKKAASEVRFGRFLLVLLSTGAVLRLAAAPIIEGHPIDIACFKSWAVSAANDLPHFYNSAGFVDYPPAYIYVLYVVAKAAKIFGFINSSWAYTLAIKLPPMAADVVTAYFIYKLGAEKLSEKWRLLLAGIYLFNPLVILNSALWGQVDSFFTMLIAAALLLLIRNNLPWSAVLYAVAILMKPQGIIFLPVLFFELVRRRKVMNFVKCFLYALAAGVIIILPFSFSQHPLWIFKLILNTASSYKGASINAFNLFALLGANWKEDTLTLFIFSYSTWGFIFIVLTTLFSWFLYIKGKGEALPLLTSILLITGVFMLSSKMHERYMYPALALSLMAFVFLKDRRILWFYAVSSITGFINTYMVFSLSLKKVYWVPADDWVLKLVSIVNIILLIYLGKLCVDLSVRNRLLPVASRQDNDSKSLKQARRKGQVH